MLSGYRVNRIDKGFVQADVVPLKTDGRFKERMDGRDKVGYNLSASTEMNIVKVYKYPRR